MPQKVFRLIALLFFILLILLPIYSKYITHYTRSIHLTDDEMTNITKDLLPKEHNCTLPPKIKLNFHENIIQILHFTSPDCHGCINDAQVWKEFLLTLSNEIKKHNMKDEVVILHVFNHNSLKSNNIKNFAEKITDNRNLNICIAGANFETIKNMNIDVLPSLIIVKNNHIIYSVSGPLDQFEIKNIIEIITHDH